MTLRQHLRAAELFGLRGVRGEWPDPVFWAVLAAHHGRAAQRLAGLRDPMLHDGIPCEFE